MRRRRGADPDVRAAILHGATGLDARDVAARLDALEFRVAHLEKARRDSDDRDGDVLLALRASAGDRAFTAKDVVERAAVDVELRRVLRDAGLSSPRRLGAFCKRIRGRSIGEFRLDRLGEKVEDGVVWIIRRADSRSGESC